MYASPVFTAPRAFGYSSARNSQALSDDQIRRLAPSVFAESAHESRSARYAYIPTSDVLKGLRNEGFEVFSATQSRARSTDRIEHTKHMLRLRHAGDSARALSVGDSVPEIVLINSHDGTSSYKMMAGIFRIVCSNGLIVADSTIGDIKVNHAGKVQDKVIEGAFEILDGFTRVIEDRETMRALTLSNDEQQIFARAALSLRYDDDKPTPVDPAQILMPRRIEDRAPDMWTTFNRVQENMVRGGVRARSSNGSRTHTREIRGIDQSVKINRALWMLADEMAKLKAAN